MGNKRKYEKSEGEFIKIEYRILWSEAWKKLSPTAQAIYLQLKAAIKAQDSRGKEYNKSYRKIKFGFSDMRAKISKGAFYRAIKELIEHGFIEVVSKGSSNKNQFGKDREQVRDEKLVKKTTVYDLLREDRKTQ